MCCGFACSSLVSRNQCDARQPNYLILNVLTIAVKVYNIILCRYCERIFDGFLSKPHLNIWAFNLACFSICNLKPKPNRFYTEALVYLWRSNNIVGNCPWNHYNIVWISISDRHRKVKCKVWLTNIKCNQEQKGSSTRTSKNQYPKSDSKYET